MANSSRTKIVTAWMASEAYRRLHMSIFESVEIAEREAREEFRWLS